MPRHRRSLLSRHRPRHLQMPLSVNTSRAAIDLICATRNWSSYPPEAFNIDFMRAFWPMLTPQDQAATEATAFFFVTTHWGPPNAPAADLSHVATPADFPDEVFSSLEARTTRIEFEVPKRISKSWGGSRIPAGFASAGSRSRRRRTSCVAGTSKATASPATTTGRMSAWTVARASIR